MKIYFGFTVAGDRSGIEIARKVVLQLGEMGHEVLTRHLVSENAWERDRLIGPQDVYRRDMAAFSSASSSLLKYPAGPSVWDSKQVICWVQPPRKLSCSIALRCNRRFLF